MAVRSAALPWLSRGVRGVAVCWTNTIFKTELGELGAAP